METEAATEQDNKPIASQTSEESKTKGKTILDKDESNINSEIKLKRQGEESSSKLEASELGEEGNKDGTSTEERDIMVLSPVNQATDKSDTSAEVKRGRVAMDPNEEVGETNDQTMETELEGGTGEDPAAKKQRIKEGRVDATEATIESEGSDSKRRKIEKTRDEEPEVNGSTHLQNETDGDPKFEETDQIAENSGEPSGARAIELYSRSNDGSETYAITPLPVVAETTDHVANERDSGISADEGQPLPIREDHHEGPDNDDDEVDRVEVDLRRDINSQDSNISGDLPKAATPTDQSLGGSRAQDENSKNAHTRSKHVDPKVLETRRKIQMCCRDNDLATAMDEYQEAISTCTTLEPNTFYSLLNLCDGLDRSVHIGTPKHLRDSNDVSETRSSVREVDNRARQAFAFEVKTKMEAMDIPLNETSYTAIVRILARNREFGEASKVLEESEKVQQCRPKLRLYAPLLIAYCNERRIKDAMECWLKLVKQGLSLSEKELLAVMKCAISVGGTVVMERILTQIAEEVAVPSKDTVAAILEWFVSAHAAHAENIILEYTDDERVRNLLVQIRESEGGEDPPSMGPVVNTTGWEVSSSVRIDPATGVLLSGCLEGHKLNPVPLSERSWSDMKEMNETIVLKGEVEGNRSQFAGGKKGKKNMNFNPEERKKKWQFFVDFLHERGPFDVVIDGANVGYFEQNFAGAPKHVDYQQIDWVVQEFKKQGKRALLVLHQRHFSQGLPLEAFSSLQKCWEESGVLFRSPPGMNDDWFWMHAALTYKSLVVTNDEMRDHHFQMLAPRNFLRWKERHQVHFGFGEHEDLQNGTRRRRVELHLPVPYSRRVQRVEDGFVVPLAKRGDEHRFLDGTHVASEDEPGEETYLCLRPASASAK